VISALKGDLTRTDRLCDIGGGHDQHIFPVFQLVQLGQERVDHLCDCDRGICSSSGFSVAYSGRIDRTRNSPVMRLTAQSRSSRPLLPLSDFPPRLFTKQADQQFALSTSYRRLDSPIRTTTNPLSSSTISFTLANNFCTNLPDSENHFENKLCELISTNLPRAYRSDSRMASF
jgi:hypothetical protein